MTVALIDKLMAIALVIGGVMLLILLIVGITEWFKERR